MTRRCKICKEFGTTIEDLAERLHVSESSVKKWYDRGVLKEVLNGKKPKSRCLYRRIYGISIAEIAQKLQKDISIISRLHHSGQLIKILKPE